MSTGCETNYFNVTTPLILHTNDVKNSIESRCNSNLKHIKSPLIFTVILILLCCIILLYNNNTPSPIHNQSHILSQPHIPTKVTMTNSTINDDNRVVVVLPGKRKKGKQKNKANKGSKGGNKKKSKSAETPTTTIMPTFSPSFHHETTSPIPTATKRSSKSSEISSTHIPSLIPTQKPTLSTTRKPTKKPTKFPSKMPTQKPSKFPTHRPTLKPTKKQQTQKPTHIPTMKPIHRPTNSPTHKPSKHPSHNPTMRPTKHKNLPTLQPTNHHKMTQIPSIKPTVKPTHSTTKTTERPTQKPSNFHTTHPTQSPKVETYKPTQSPVHRPSHSPTMRPSHSEKSIETTPKNSKSPTTKPTHSSSSTPTPTAGNGANKPSQSPVSNITTWHYMIDVEIRDVADHLEVSEDEIKQKIKSLIDGLSLNNKYILNVNVDKNTKFHSDYSEYNAMQTTEAQSFNIGIFIYTLNEFDMQIITKYVQSDEFKQQLKDLLHQSNDEMMTVGVGVSDIEPNNVQHTLMYYVLPSIISLLICIAICCGAYRCFGREVKEDEMLLIEEKEKEKEKEEKGSYQQIVPKIRAVDVPSLSGIDFDSNLMRTPPECRGNLEYVD